MYDNVSFRVNNYSIEDFEEFIDRIGEPVSYGNDKYNCNWYNLRVVYYPNSQTLKVSNSLHKFYNAAVEGLGGFNHNDFTYSQLVKVISLLEKTINRSSVEMKLQGKFEYGLNIDTDKYEPFKDIIERYQSIVTTATNPFYAYFNGSSKPYGKFCPFTDYKVKCYDKGKQLGIQDHILRIEIVHNNVLMTRSVLGMRSPTMADLLVKENWYKLFEKLNKIYSHIRMLAYPNELTEEYGKILCYAHATVNKDYKKVFQKVLPEMKEAHDKMRDDPNSPHSLVSKSIPVTFERLVNN